MPYYLAQLYWYSYQFSRRVRHYQFSSKELSAHLDVSRGCEALFSEAVEDYCFLKSLQGVAVIPSFCEMKCEPVFKPLQGNPAFF